MSIPTRKLGKTDVDVTILGLGGEGVLRTFGYEQDAYDVINRALDLGINYFESARAYAGSEQYYGRSLGAKRKSIFLTSKSHDRSKQGALVHLSETLSNMRTDYLDLWQVHDVRDDSDIQEIFGPSGAIEAFDEAKRKGLVRFVGVTGHHDPAILKKCIELYDFDTVLISVNPAECHYKSLAEGVIPIARQKNMGIIAMKTYARGFVTKLPFYESMEPFFRYTLSKPVSLTVIGCDSVAQVEENVHLAESFKEMSAAEMKALEKLVAPYARKLMYYKP